MKNNSKRGFTIVELIIVIAVIAILAAMLIPTFSELIRQTQEAKDTSLVRELNVALRMDTDNAGHETMDQAVKAAAANGIDLSKHKATVPGNVILWDSENDLFAYYKVDKDGNNGEISYIPEYQPAKQLKDAYKFWTVVTDIDGNSAYSQYLAGTDKTGDVVVTAGFDAGDNTGIATVTYNGGSTAKKVIIRTNSSATTLNINAYVGATAQDSDTVKHYGYLGKLVVNTMATASYHEYGTVAFATINQGRVVAEDKGVIEVAYVTDASAFVQENGGVVTQAYAATQDIASASAEEGKKTLTYDKDVDVDEIGNAKVNEAIREEQARNLPNCDRWIDVPALVGVTAFANGEGTELNPYEIGSVVELSLFAANVWNDVDGYATASYKLTANLDLSGKIWSPIGTMEHPFGGTFDGGNKQIVGLNNGTLTTTEDVWTSETWGTVGSSYGLFGIVSGNENAIVTIKNINLDVNISLPEHGQGVGGLVGFAKAGNYSLTLQSVVVDGIVKGTKHVGGVVGKTYCNGAVTFIDVNNKSTVMCTNYNGIEGPAGGVCGFIRNSEEAKLIRVANIGAVSNTYSEMLSTSHVGGIVGWIAEVGNKGTTLFEQCISSGSVSIVSQTVKNEAGIGGIIGNVGNNYNGITFKGCTNNIDITLTNGSYAGSFIAQYTAKVNIVLENLTIDGNEIKNTNNGKISATNADTTFKNSYATVVRGVLVDNGTEINFNK